MEYYIWPFFFILNLGDYNSKIGKDINLNIKTSFDSCYIEYYQTKDSFSLTLNNKGGDTIAFKHGAFIEQSNGNTSFSFNFYMDSSSVADTINGGSTTHILKPYSNFQFIGKESKIRYKAYGVLSKFYWFLEIGKYRKKLYKIDFK